MNDVMLSKDELENRDERWLHVARQKGYECSICGETITFPEKDIYFETKLCSYHAHVMAKDD